MHSSRVMLIVAVTCVIIGFVLGSFRKQIGHTLIGDSSPSPAQAVSTTKLPIKQARPIEAKVEAPKPPLLGWKPIKSETLELNTLDVRFLGSMKQPGKMKISLDGESAVFFGVFPASELQEAKQHNRPLLQGDFAQAKCGGVGIVQSEIECDVVPEDVLVLRDKRSVGSVAIGLFGGMARNSQMVDRGIRPNKVKYQVSLWDCIENCPAR